MRLGDVSYNAAMTFLLTISAITAASLCLAASGAVVDRKLMGSAGLRQPAADS